MREIRAAIEEKKKAGLLTDEEIREIASRPLRPVLQPHDLKSGLLAELLERPSALELRLRVGRRSIAAAAAARAGSWRRSAARCARSRSSSGTRPR